MKESNLKVINNPVGYYDFSFKRCLINETGCYILGVVFGIFIFLVFYSGSSDGALSALPYAMLFASPCFIAGIYTHFSTKRIRKHMSSGEIVDGEIVCYYRDFFRSRRGFSTKPSRSNLVIKFNYHGDYYCELYAGTKLPQKVLSSPKCNVHIYDERLFIEGFELRSKSSPQIEIREIDKYYLKSIMDDYNN